MLTKQLPKHTGNLQGFLISCISAIGKSSGECLYENLAKAALLSAVCFVSASYTKSLNLRPHKSYVRTKFKKYFKEGPNRAFNKPMDACNEDRLHHRAMQKRGGFYPSGM